MRMTENEENTKIKGKIISITFTEIFRTCVIVNSYRYQINAIPNFIYLTVQISMITYFSYSNLVIP